MKIGPKIRVKTILIIFLFFYLFSPLDSIYTSSSIQYAPFCYSAFPDSSERWRCWNVANKKKNERDEDKSKNENQNEADKTASILWSYSTAEGIRLRILMKPIGETAAARPAPSVVALSAGHVRAAFILLNGCLAWRALMGTYLISPVFVQFLLSLSTSLSFVPSDLAFVAKVFLAANAFSLLLTFYEFIYSLTSWIRTELLVLWYSDLVIAHEL